MHCAYILHHLLERQSLMNVYTTDSGSYTKLFISVVNRDVFFYKNASICYRRPLFTPRSHVIHILIWMEVLIISQFVHLLFAFFCLTAMKKSDSGEMAGRKVPPLKPKRSSSTQLSFDPPAISGPATDHTSSFQSSEPSPRGEGGR